MRSQFQAAARTFGERSALTYKGLVLSFSDWFELSTQLAGALWKQGVGAGDVVTFQLPNRPEASVIFGACALLGAVCNPVPPIYRGRELRFILEQARSRIVFIPAEWRTVDFPELYRSLKEEISTLEAVVVLDREPADGMLSWDAFLADASALPDPLPAVDADDIALLIYTSGTTADPKGVLHSSNTLSYEARSWAEFFEVNELDVVFNPSPVTHMTGISMALVKLLYTGHHTVLQDAWDPDEAWDLVRRHGATLTCFSTPFITSMLSSSAGSDSQPPLRYVICGGADMQPDLIAASTATLGPTVRMYGSSECPSATSSTNRESPRLREHTDGHWLEPTEGKIADERGNELPRGAVGEILLRGPDMFLGYLDPSLNEEAFTDDGFFRTGDLGQMDDAGSLLVVGRVKDIINRSGEKFSAFEIEQLLGRHPAVREVAVVAGPDPKTGERAYACIATESDHTIDLAEIVDFLNGFDLAKQKLPEGLLLFTSLPKNPSGKIQKASLRQWLAGEIAEPPELLVREDRGG